MCSAFTSSLKNKKVEMSWILSNTMHTYLWNSNNINFDPILVLEINQYDEYERLNDKFQILVATYTYLKMDSIWGMDIYYSTYTRTAERIWMKFGTEIPCSRSSYFIPDYFTKLWFRMLKLVVGNVEVVVHACITLLQI